MRSWPTASSRGGEAPARRRASARPGTSSSDLLHGGSPIHDNNRTRASLVFHYYSEADCRRGFGELVPLNGAYWEKRTPQTVPKPGREWTGDGPFPEQAYLERHGDVKAAVLRGDFKSGESHYVAFGRREGRLI